MVAVLKGDDLQARWDACYALLRDGQSRVARQYCFKNSRPQRGHRWAMDSNSVQVNALGRKLLFKSGLFNDPLSWYYNAPERLGFIRAALASGEQLLWFPTGKMSQMNYGIFDGLMDGEQALGWVAIKLAPHVHMPAPDIHFSWAGSG